MPKRNGFKDFLWRHSAGTALLIMVVFVAFLGFVGYTYVVITKKFDSSRRWDLPSRVYSDATPLVPGMSYPRSLLEPKLNHVGYHEVRSRIANPSEYRFVDGSLEIYLQNFDYPDMEFRAMPVRVDFDGPEVTAVHRLDDGAALRGVRIEPELITSIYNNEMEDRLPVSLSAVPKVVTNAVIATEDKNFYHHEGISIRGTLGALITDLRQHSWTHGGSTLTQQLVKNLYLNPERTWRRKIMEALMAAPARGPLLEGRHSRGLRQRDLPRPERCRTDHRRRAGLAGLLRKARHLSDVAGGGDPGRDHPFAERPLSAQVPGAGEAPSGHGAGTDARPAHDHEAEYESAVATPLSVSRFPRTSRSAPFFVDLVMKQLRETYPETQLKTEGLRIFTTLDTIMQRAAEQSLDSGIADLKKRYSFLRKSPTPLEGVVLTIQPGTGYVKALVGGENYSKTQFNRAIQARRQPGSLFKPFVYITAMDPARGQQALTAATILDDSPISIRTGTSVWEPQNSTIASTVRSRCDRLSPIRTTSRRCARPSTPAFRTWSRPRRESASSRGWSRIRRSHSARSK